MISGQILIGDCREVLKTLSDESVNCVVTSPPYWGLRDYGVEGQLGLEKTPEEYVGKLVEIFREVRRVLRSDGTVWLNLGDTYAGSWGDSGNRPERTGKPGHQRTRVSEYLQRSGHPQVDKPVTVSPPGLKPKDLVGIPWRVAFALQSDGWWLRQDIIEEVELYCPCGCGFVLQERIWRYSQDREIIWKKPNPMPESVTDRCTKSHEYIFLLSKSKHYYYDAKAIAEESLNAGRVVTNNNGKNGQMGKYGQTRGGFMADEGVTVTETRNKRSVWEVATQPFSDWQQTSRRERVAADVASDGTKRITSPNCPVHGGQLVLLPTGAYGERADDGSIRTVRTYSHPAQELIIGYESTDQTRALGFPGGNSDCLPLEYFAFAIRHNIGTSKTAPVQLTNPPCNASEKILYRIDGRLVLLDSVDLVDRISANSIERAYSGDHLSVQTSSRNADTFSFESSDCLCEYYKTVEEKQSHFATYPPDLIKPCILAGCPEGGIVLDPFGGSGTTGQVAESLGRNWILIELNENYKPLIQRRTAQVGLL